MNGALGEVSEAATRTLDAEGAIVTRVGSPSGGSSAPSQSSARRPPAVS